MSVTTNYILKSKMSHLKKQEAYLHERNREIRALKRKVKQQKLENTRLRSELEAWHDRIGTMDLELPEEPAFKWNKQNAAAPQVVHGSAQGQQSKGAGTERASLLGDPPATAAAPYHLTDAEQRALKRALIRSFPPAEDALELPGEPVNEIVSPRVMNYIDALLSLVRKLKGRISQLTQLAQERALFDATKQALEDTRKRAEQAERKLAEAEARLWIIGQ